jgi:DNA invertase Pin-like site-specific DNA recombinase
MKKGTHHKPKTRKLQSERITESLAALREQGVQLGRPELEVNRVEILKLQRTCMRCGKAKDAHAHADHQFKAHSLRAIADKLGCSVNTVQVRLGKLSYSKYRS